ncbi:hypothetical protein [Bartonella vinsonii]|uniref:hypothetical protein n=1 Tax=Bartonella vinsonii TaxID=33047 RepID=UPI00031F6517|nr:hypothetical protein [Bartonella vinsonii]
MQNVPCFNQVVVNFSLLKDPLHFGKSLLTLSSTTLYTRTIVLIAQYFPYEFTTKTSSDRLAIQPHVT